MVTERKEVVEMMPNHKVSAAVSPKDRGAKDRVRKWYREHPGQQAFYKDVAKEVGALEVTTAGAAAALAKEGYLRRVSPGVYVYSPTTPKVGTMWEALTTTEIKGREVTLVKSEDGEVACILSLDELIDLVSDAS